MLQKDKITSEQEKNYLHFIDSSNVPNSTFKPSLSANENESECMSSNQCINSSTKSSSEQYLENGKNRNSNLCETIGRSRNEKSTVYTLSESISKIRGNGKLSKDACNREVMQKLVETDGNLIEQE